MIWSLGVGVEKPEKLEKLRLGAELTWNERETEIQELELELD
jgi:hypothetical protein